MTNSQLKAAITTARAGKRRGRYPASLKAQVVEYCREGRESGRSWGDIGNSLGLGENQVRVWTTGGRGAPRQRLKRIRVLDAAPSAASTSEAKGRGIRVELPHGVVVTGLEPTELAALLKALL